MNILLALSVLSLTSVLVVFIYIQGWAKKKVFHDLLEIRQIVVLIVLTTVFALFFMNVFFTMIKLPNVNLLFISDILILNILGIFLSLGILGNGIHFTGKVLSHNLRDCKSKKVRKNGYFFHISLGHNLVYIFTSLVSALMILLEINHPTSQVSPTSAILIIFFGVLWALSWTFTTTAGLVDKRIYIFLDWILSLGVLSLVLALGINPLTLPYSIFFFTTIFLTAFFITLIYVIEKIKMKNFVTLMSKKAKVELTKPYYLEKLG